MIMQRRIEREIVEEEYCTATNLLRWKNGKKQQ